MKQKNNSKKALIKIAIKAKEYINKQKALKIKGGGNNEDIIQKIENNKYLINIKKEEIELTIDLIKRKEAMINELKNTEELMGRTFQTEEISKYIIKLIIIKQKLNTEINELNEIIKIKTEENGKLIDENNELYRDLQEPD